MKKIILIIIHIIIGVIIIYNTIDYSIIAICYIILMLNLCTILIDDK